MPIASCAPLMMPSSRSGWFSKQNTRRARVSGSMFGRLYGQMRRMTLRVLVDSPQRSRTSNVGSSEIVMAQPGAYWLTYGWSIHVPAKSRRVGIWLSVFLRSVLLRAFSPSWGSRSRTTYSIPRSSQRRRLSSLPPSLFTTRMSGFTMSSVGRKSNMPLPALIYASLT